MTDGQSFYFVLTLFYLIECIKFAPPHSRGFVSFLSRVGRFRPRSPFMIAWGLKKTVFLAPVLPWPSTLYLVYGYTFADHATKRLKTASAILRHQRFLQRATRLLRRLSVLNFLNFFLFLPLVYIRTYDETAILYGLAYCYAILLLTAAHYRALHKRLFPSRKADRFKTTIYTALLPWHAPRSADDIFITASESWSPLATLAANANSPDTLALLKKSWREANFQPQAPVSTQNLGPILDAVHIDNSDWLNPPSDIESPQYCPCCHQGYEATATHCHDCQRIELRPTPNKGSIKP